MFTTNAVQTGTVPTLQYQEHTIKKSNPNNLENAEQKDDINQQQEDQQTQVHFWFLTLSLELKLIHRLVKLPIFCQRQD